MSSLIETWSKGDPMEKKIVASLVRYSGMWRPTHMIANSIGDRGGVRKVRAALKKLLGKLPNLECDRSQENCYYWRIKQ